MAEWQNYICSMLKGRLAACLKKFYLCLPLHLEILEILYLENLEYKGSKKWEDRTAVTFKL